MDERTYGLMVKAHGERWTRKIFGPPPHQVRRRELDRDRLDTRDLIDRRVELRVRDLAERIEHVAQTGQEQAHELTAAVKDGILGALTRIDDALVRTQGMLTDLSRTNRELETRIATLEAKLRTAATESRSDALELPRFRHGLN